LPVFLRKHSGSAVGKGQDVVMIWLGKDGLSTNLQSLTEFFDGIRMLSRVLYINESFQFDAYWFTCFINGTPILHLPTRRSSRSHRIKIRWIVPN
jgi:hypothetical protein